jgi:hypothetical protein
MPSQERTTNVSDEPALLRMEGPIATITLNPPAAFNSVDLSIAKRLEQLGAEVEANDAIRVLVIQGEGRAFSAGGDLKTLGAAAAAGTIAAVVGEQLKHYHAFIETVRRMPKIVLSSVHGSAAGAGMGLAFVADLCIAAEDARFTPAYAKIGASPDGGSTVGLGRPGCSCRRTKGGDAKTRRATGPEFDSGNQRYQVAGLPGRGNTDQTATRCRRRENHRGDENRRIPCRREEIHQQGKIGSSFKIA